MSLSDIFNSQTSKVSTMTIFGAYISFDHFSNDIVIYDKTKAAYACGGGTAATTTIQLGVNADNLTITTATSQAVANGLLSATPVSIRVQH